MTKALKRTISVLLAVVALSGTLLMSSCGAPALDEIRDDYVALIKASAEVNDILFGKGLSGYGNLEYDKESGIYYTYYYTAKDGRLCAYRDTEQGKYVVLAVKGEDGDGCIYKNEEKGLYYYKTDIEYDDVDPGLPDTPYGYSHVRVDERCTSINEIAAMASKVYSEDYLADIFTLLFGDERATDSQYATAPKYIEITDEKSGKKYLLCADSKTVPPIDNGERVYDYDSMKIAKRSRRNYVNVEIRAYGKYADTEKGEIVTGWHTVSLSFVRQSGGWRLDSPTY